MDFIQNLALTIANFGGAPVGIAESTCILSMLFTVITMISFWSRYTPVYKIILVFVFLQCGEYLILNNLWDTQVENGVIRIADFENATWRYFEAMYFSLILMFMNFYTELVNFRNLCFLEMALKGQHIDLITKYERMTPKGWERNVFRTIEVMAGIIYFGSWGLLVILQRGTM